MKNKNAIMLLASMMSIRMLGLFMILPVFSVAAMQLAGATPKLIGIALGIYGLTQAGFQLPLGFLSDHFGRKRVIFAGLCLFFVGSILGATTHTIHTMILARALQGTGAIGSTILALAADLTSVSARTKAMAMIGMSIGFAFTLAMILGPIINHYLQLRGIFWITAMLTCVAMGCLLKIPSHKKNKSDYHFEKKNFFTLLFNKSLLLLDISIFTLHAILTAMFIAVPITLTHLFLLSSSEQIVLYCAILILGFGFAIPLIISAEKHKKIRPMFLTAITLILMTELIFLIMQRQALSSFALLFATLLLFFIGFTTLEALLPSMVSKTISPQKKGAAMGIYSTAQFLGIFAGGALGGIIYAHFGLTSIFSFCSVLAAAWFLIIWFHQKLIALDPQTR